MEHFRSEALLRAQLEASQTELAALQRVETNSPVVLSHYQSQIKELQRVNETMSQEIRQLRAELEEGKSQRHLEREEFQNTLENVKKSYEQKLYLVNNQLKYLQSSS
eukprot:Sdes_comp10200_c0_seq2m1817